MGCRPRCAFAFIIPLSVAACSVLSLPKGGLANAPQLPALIENFRHDASLTDVFFISRTTGWAVGDRGIIWHTSDGGTNWRQQSSTVTCGLNSVFFIDANRGWAAGGEFQPHTVASRGVIIRTDDGGNTWTELPRILLPRIARIKFFDHNRGIAVGDCSSTQPSGVFATQDGGDSWQLIHSAHEGGWLTGDFLNPNAGAVAGAAGRFALLGRHQIMHQSHDQHSPRSVHSMRLVPPTAGWLAGDGGLILTTKDAGQTWQSPSGEVALAAGPNGQFDLHALAVRDQHVWLAGTPGTRIFHCADNGQTWQSFPTGQSAPIRAITFTDTNHGFAVGDFGNILATTDAGRTWTTQRTGGQRAALLGIFADAGDAPLEVFASLGAADGYLPVIEILHATARTDETPDFPTSQRCNEALRLAGASVANTAWRFPLPPSDLEHTPPELLAALNGMSDGRAVEQIEQHLVRSIRMWRPDVIITRQPKLESCTPRQAILAAVVMESINAAADPTRHLDLAADVGLAPWQVKKVFGILPAGSSGAESMSADVFSPLLGATLANFVAPARQLLAPAKPPPNNYDFDLLASTVQNHDGPRGLFSGISLAKGSDARRPSAALPGNDLDQLKRTAERRRQLEGLLKRTEGNAAWAAQVGKITDGMNADDGASLLMQLGDGYRAADRLDLAADTYYLLARRYPEHTHAARALEWLIQFYASSETAHRLASRGSHNVRQANLEIPQSGERVSAGGKPADTSPTISLSRDDRLHRATQLTEYLRTSKPESYAEPRVRFAEVAALRQLGLAGPAKSYYLALRQLPNTNPWRNCGDAETWLTKPAESRPTKALAHCRPTADRPLLDGQLSEPFWDATDRLRLSASSETSTEKRQSEVRLAYDNEHLYIAIRCPKIPSPQPPVPPWPEPVEGSPPRARPRDADLSQNDRVTLRIDIDRDYSTAFELCVDSRGWTHDACWGDARWNPTWYVAAAHDDETWTIEAAVPLTELVKTPPAVGHAWAVSACHTIPRVGYQTWAGDPAADSPAQFGLVIFE